MIAKLPGETKFMGPHLEIICLLQAAEIERLCLFLEEYKVKYKYHYSEYDRARGCNWTATPTKYR
jgi:hypothetical protein